MANFIVEGDDDEEEAEAEAEEALSGLSSLIDDESLQSDIEGEK